MPRRKNTGVQIATDQSPSPKCIGTAQGKLSIRELACLEARIERTFATLDKGNLEAIREALSDALRCASYFWRHVRRYRRLAEPTREEFLPSNMEVAIEALANALDDVNLGVESALFRPKKLSHRRPDSKQVWILRAEVAAALELLIMEGLSKKAAINRVVLDYPNLCKLVRPSQMISGCLSTWHRDFMGGRVENSAAQYLFLQLAEGFDFGRRSFQSDRPKFPIIGTMLSSVEKRVAILIA